MAACERVPLVGDLDQQGQAVIEVLPISFFAWLLTAFVTGGIISYYKGKHLGYQLGKLEANEERKALFGKEDEGDNGTNTD